MAPVIARQITKCRSSVTWYNDNHKFAVYTCSYISQGPNRKTPMTTVPDYHCHLHGNMHRWWWRWEDSVLPTMPNLPLTPSEYISKYKASVVIVYVASLLLPIFKEKKFAYKNYRNRRRENDQCDISIYQYLTLNIPLRTFDGTSIILTVLSRGSPQPLQINSWTVRGLGHFPLLSNSFQFSSYFLVCTL